MNAEFIARLAVLVIEVINDVMAGRRSRDQLETINSTLRYERLPEWVQPIRVRPIRTVEVADGRWELALLVIDGCGRGHAVAVRIEKTYGRARVITVATTHTPSVAAERRRRYAMQGAPV